MSLAVLFGPGKLAAYIRRNIPDDIPGIDVRLDRLAGNSQYRSRRLIKIDELATDKIRDVLLQYDINEMILCGRPALNTIDFGDLKKFIAGTGRIREFSLSAAAVFNSIEEDILSVAGVSVVGAEKYIDGLTPGFGTIVTPPNCEPVPTLFTREIYEALPSPRLFGAAHAAIADNAKICQVEAAAGTDVMILEYINLRKRTPPKPSSAIFYKLPLKRCNPYFDIPVIGPKTVRLLARAYVKGIVVHGRYCYIDQRQNTLELCRKYGLFLVGVEI